MFSFDRYHNQQRAADSNALRSEIQLLGDDEDTDQVPGEFHATWQRKSYSSISCGRTGYDTISYYIHVTLFLWEISWSFAFFCLSCYDKVSSKDFVFERLLTHNKLHWPPRGTKLKWNEVHYNINIVKNN